MIYFDSAATTLQKPPSVRRAMTRALLEATSPSRGGHPASMRAAEIAYQCREAAARLFGAAGPEHIVFTMNATHGLNIAIKNLVQAGERVVVSGYEHNSVMRPLHAARAEVIIAHAPLFAPEAVLRAFDMAIGSDTKLVVCNHVSNVFGFILPVAEIAALCSARGVPFVLDASQSAGMLEVNAVRLGADFIALPGHKGLYGPQGMGVLVCNRVPSCTLIEGGTGSDAKLRDMPEELPDRLEAGTPNMPGIAGLLAGIKFVERRGIERILKREKHLFHQALEGLWHISGLRVYAAEDAAHQLGVLSFCADGLDCEAVAEALGAQNIAVRAGFHCSPEAHASAGSLETGTVRISFSDFNTEREVRQFLVVLEQVVKKLRK